MHYYIYFKKDLKESIRIESRQDSEVTSKLKKELKILKIKFDEINRSMIDSNAKFVLASIEIRRLLSIL